MYFLLLLLLVDPIYKSYRTCPKTTGVAYQRTCLCSYQRICQGALTLINHRIKKLEIQEISDSIQIIASQFRVHLLQQLVVMKNLYPVVEVSRFFKKFFKESISSLCFSQKIFLDL